VRRARADVERLAKGGTARRAQRRGEPRSGARRRTCGAGAGREAEDRPQTRRVERLTLQRDPAPPEPRDYARAAARTAFATREGRKCPQSGRCWKGVAAREACAPTRQSSSARHGSQRAICCPRPASENARPRQPEKEQQEPSAAPHVRMTPGGSARAQQCARPSGTVKTVFHHPQPDMPQVTAPPQRLQRRR